MKLAVGRRRSVRAHELDEMAQRSVQVQGPELLCVGLGPALTRLISERSGIGAKEGGLALEVLCFGLP